MHAARLLAPMALGLAAGGCAILANYDFGKWEEETPDGGAGGSSTTISASTGGSTSTSSSAHATSSTSTSHSSSTGSSGSSSSSGKTSTSSSSSTSASSSASSSSSGTTCTNGSIAGQVVKTFVASSAPVGSVAVDGTAVYFTSAALANQPSVFVRADKAAPAQMSSFGLATDANARGIVLDATYAYWITTPASGGGDTLWRIPKVIGTSGTRLHTSTAGTIGGIALGNGVVYFSSTNEAPSFNNPGVFSVSAPSGPVQQVSPLGTGQVPGALAFDGTTLFAVIGMTPTLFNIVAFDPVNKGGGVYLATSESNVVGLAVDATYVYWSASSGVRRVAKTGGGVQTVVSASGSGCGGLGLDPGYVYCTDNGGMRVIQAQIAGGVQIASVPAAGAMQGIAADCSHVYFGMGSTVSVIPRL